MSLTPLTLTRLIEKPESKGLVERKSVGRSTEVYPCGECTGLHTRVKQARGNLCKRHSDILGEEQVKAFSNVCSPSMVNPAFDTPSSIWICGNDADAKVEVSTIRDQLGWQAEGMGVAEAARVIEPLRMLWCINGFTKKERMDARI